MRIIDFHTHPFRTNEENICRHAEFCDMAFYKTPEYLRGLGIKHICGSVLSMNNELPEDATMWDKLKLSNKTALWLYKKYDGFYTPGFHVHPDYVRESCEEIEKMSKHGIRLIGELVPYMCGWSDYSCKEFDEILDVAEQYNMIVNFHTMDNDQVDAMVKKHPNVTFVAAHPGDGENPQRHFDRMKMSKNYYLDLSGTGLFRHGMLRHGIDTCGVDRFIFGSDFPICSPAMYIGELMLNTLYTDEEYEDIMYNNAKRLLGLKFEDDDN